ncbi:hypothetical protein H0H93_011920 [Arthromyces matolae]|nr:hypothetical protein H0H93_011920 [Arthromyces matolae]
MQNQAAFRLATDADPKGERTIGVLTKPDSVSDGATGQLQSWKDVLEGRSFRLEHGYYCVRLPTDAERARKTSRSDFQKSAARFFQTTYPWNTIADRDRFGIPNFVANISALLVKLIEKNIPDLRAKVAQLLIECEDDLSALPSLHTGDPITEVYLRITQFCQYFESAVYGEKEKSFVQAIQRRYAVLKRSIEATRPNFEPYHQYRHLAQNHCESELVPASGPAITLADVKETIVSGWELPTHVPYDATKKYIRDCTTLWKEPAISCFNDIFVFTSDLMKKIMAHHFGQFKNLERHVALVVEKQLDAHRRDAHNKVADLLNFENIPIYTQNTELFYAEKDHWFRCYRNLAYAEVYRNDGNYDAVDVMATVRAYFQVAHKRVIDHVPLCIENALNQSLAKGLSKHLLESLQEGDADMSDQERMAELLEEDPEVAKKRVFLMDRLTRLKSIKQKLDMFELSLVEDSD